MADKETGLNITVGAVADEGSAKKAAKDLAKGVLSSLKDGYIEVPAEIKVPIKNASKDLEKAQKDVIDQWKKTFKSGFSSSAKDLDDLTEAYHKFKRLAGKEHKAGTKQYREISKLMGGQIQSYNTQKQARATKRAEQMAKFEEARQRQRKPKAKNFGIHSKEEIDANIKSEQKRRMKGIKSTLPAGFGNGWVDPGRTNEYEAKLSEVSSYRSNMARQMRRSQKEARKWERDSLTNDKYSSKEELEAELEKRHATDKKLTKSDRNIKIVDKDGKKVPQTVVTAWDMSWNTKARPLSPAQTAGQISDTLRQYILPELLDKIQKSETDEEVSKLTDDFFNAIDTISKYSLDAGRLVLNDAKQTVGITMGKLGYTTSGNIGGTEGGDSTEASRNPKIVPVLKGMLDKIGEKEEAIKEEIMRLEELEKTTHKSSKSKKSAKGSNSMASRILAETRASKATQKQATKEVTEAVKKTEKAIETQTSYDKIEHSAERVTDKTDEQKSDKLIAEVSKDSKSNSDTEDLGNSGDIEDLGDQIRGDIERSNISTTIKDPHSWVSKLKDAFAELTDTTANYKKIMSATSEEQDRLAAERIKQFGLSRGRNATDNGDKILFARRWSLFRGKDKFGDLFKDINLSKGIKVDTTAITDKLAKALSGKEMLKAHTGGFKSNILGAMTGGLSFAFSPSLEKSRARAEGINQIMANIRKAANDILQDIQNKESTLTGMEASGSLKLGANGEVLEGSSMEAKTLVLQLEESKQVLASILADAGMVDNVVSKTHGKLGGIVKQLGFTSPVLRQNNAILANLNAGLDKTGKALKNQTRLAEVLSYTYRLITRHTAQVLKNFLLQLNPLTQIKKAFQDFMSYNTKWQRTMNVIKYNIHSILEPFMDKIAQFLVNCIGFVDIISMKVQEAFGHIPISLFDQAAADARKIHEELEAGANVTAGFDELHDIGSNNTGANDLLGEIYKPELPESWKKLATEIGDLFAGLIKGDLGFGEVMKRILTILWDTLKTIATTIWDWFKKTAIGKYITDHWKDILGKVLAAFLAWKLLKVAGKLLWNALFGNFGQGAIGGLFSKLGGWILKALGATAFGRGIIEGIKTLFVGSGGLLSTLKSIFVGHEAITAFGAWGETLGALFAQTLLAAVGIAIGVGGIAKGFDMVADTKSYNMGLLEGGGKSKDKKSDFGGKAVGTILGGIGGGVAGTAIAGLATGGPIGLAIGAIAGLLITSLAPAFEEVEVTSKKANNEMQKIKYYEGLVKGAEGETNIFKEQLELLQQSLELNTQAVYDQGEKLGISRTRMDELVKATQDGTFTTDMLTGSETGLATSLTDLAQKQEHVTEVSKRLEEAQKKLLKAQTDLSIAQDVEAGNFEVAAARIEVAEVQGVYTTEEATKKRIQLYKEAGKEERTNLLQNLTPEQRRLMVEYTNATDTELAKIAKSWRESSDNTKKSLLDGVGDETRRQFESRMNDIDNVIRQHQGFWQGVGDTLKEIFTFGNSTTWTYDGEDKYYKEGYDDKYYQQIANDYNSGNQNKYTADVIEELRRRKLIPSFAIGTNFVPNDGLAYLHQGEAVIPAKYNQPYKQGLSNEERAYMQQMTATMRSLDGTMKRGIAVNGQFTQRGSDLVAVVNKTKSQTGADLLSNISYAR